MAKDTYYFSHDFSARNDPKLQKVLMKLGQEGKGVFWDLVEMLYEQDGRLLLSDIDSYSFALRTKESVVMSLINDFGLFQTDEIYFWSNSAMKRLEKREEKSQRYSDAAKSRWSKTNTEIKIDYPQFYILHCYNNDESFFKCGITSESVSRRYSGKLPYQYDILLQIFSNDYMSIESEYSKCLSNYKYEPKINFGGKLECFDLSCYDVLKNITTKNVAIETINNFNASHNNITATLMRRNAIKEIKEKENKVKEIKKEGDLFGVKIDFIVFWDLYNHKKGDKAAAQKEWNKLPIETQNKIIEFTPNFILSLSDKKFQPYPTTFLNQKRWNDELTIKLKPNDSTTIIQQARPKFKFQGGK